MQGGAVTFMKYANPPAGSPKQATGLKKEIQLRTRQSILTSNQFRTLYVFILTNLWTKSFPFFFVLTQLYPLSLNGLREGSREEYHMTS